MTKTCTFPMGHDLTKEGTPYYKTCGNKAEYKVGFWYICEGHKKYYADRHGYKTEKIKEA